jgi:hypothetical protein
MFNIIKGITKIALSPLSGVKEVIDDISGDNSETEQGLSILTTGISSVAKGTAKGIIDGVEDIFED